MVGVVEIWGQFGALDVAGTAVDDESRFEGRFRHFGCFCWWYPVVLCCLCGEMQGGVALPFAV